MEDISFGLDTNDLPAILTIFLTIIGYNTYWFLAESSRKKEQLAAKYPSEEASKQLVLFQKYTGFFFLGLLPFVICLIVLPYTLPEYGLSFQKTGLSLIWILGLSAIILPLNIKAGKRPENLKVYPMMRVSNWDKKLVFQNSLATMSYLFGYELLFRGLLLFSCVDVLGVWPAIAVNVALYSAVHLPKGAGETIGAIPFGLLICYITLTTGTIWVAVVIHWVLSLSNDYLAVHYNPKMKFKFSS